MSKLAHTPGPWAVEDRRNAPLPNVRIVAGTHEVAQVSDVHMRCRQSPVRWTDEEADAKDALGLANALLIAAVPDLLAACKLWDEGFIDGEEFTQRQFMEWVNKNRRAARAAIAKAEGGAT